MFKEFINNKRVYIYGGLGVVALIVIAFFVFHGSTLIVKGTALVGKTPKPTGLLSGAECDSPHRRPLAVMVSSDPEARPLSGVGEADMVFEMPVTPSGTTRMMAVFQCVVPEEIGSVRSARLDFVPIALGLDAIYAHFGGEHEVLAELNSGIIDNIDGLKYDGTIYYRKKGIPRPHNAFTSAALIDKVVEKLGYSQEIKLEGYPHDKKSKATLNESSVSVYSGIFKVSWNYDPETNSYLRIRSNLAEKDKNSSQSVAAQNIIVMKTTWSPINKDYIRVKTVGSGTVTLYKDGQTFSGTWSKQDDKSKLYFYDINGKELELAPGKTWVEIVI